MTKAVDPETQLASFLAKFTPEIADLAVTARRKMRKIFPTALELVYDNYNALAIGYGPTERASEAIFSIALFPRWVSLFFLHGKGLPDPEMRLKGSGNVARSIRLTSPAVLEEPAVMELMRAAVERATVPFDPDTFNPGTKHRLIIKSISAKQRPRRPSRS